MRIKDNDTNISRESLTEIGKLVEKVENKTLGQMRKEGILVFPNSLNESNDLTDDQMILKSYNNVYQSGNVMGFIGYEKEKLVIESRFCDDGNDYLLHYLLQTVMDLPNLLDLPIDSSREEETISELLVFLFPHYLKSAMRKGLYKKYIRFYYNDNNVKGTIDIAKHIKRNTPFVGNVTYSQREFSFDNDLMELVRHTIEFIKCKSYGGNLLNKAKDEVLSVVEVTKKYRQADRIKVISKNKQNIVRHAYYQEYGALQQLCLLIFQHQNQRIGYGKRKIYGILFDGSWLWEEYVNKLVCDKFYHPMNKVGLGGQWLFSNESKIGKIYPDFIGKDAKSRIVADAKYKPQGNISGKDYLQLLAYMFRFDAKIGFYFYPEDADDLSSVLWLNEGSTYENNVQPRDDICVKKKGLKIPQKSTSYKNFIEQIKQSEKEFIESINEFKRRNV